VPTEEAETLPARDRRERMLQMITERQFMRVADLSEAFGISDVTVIVTGGTLRRLQHSLVDPMAALLLERMHADLAFIGCNGVDVAHGVTNVNLPEAEVKRRMVAAAELRRAGAEVVQVE